MTTPTNYIETRPEAIAAIHKSITEKWNPICMGCVDSEPDCELCELYACNDCPLNLSNQRCNGRGVDPYGETSLLIEPMKHRPEGDEAMLEALVQLLPESERAVYGGK